LGQFDDGFLVGVAKEVFANCIAGLWSAVVIWTFEKWVTKLEVGGETNETSAQTCFLTFGDDRYPERRLQPRKNREQRNY
jgi:hypothetical protein